MGWIIGLLVFICATLIYGVICLEQAIRETNHKIVEHLHGISHMVTSIEQGVNGPLRRAEAQGRLDKLRGRESD